MAAYACSSRLLELAFLLSIPAVSGVDDSTARFAMQLLSRRIRSIFAFEQLVVVLDPVDVL